MRFGAKTSSGVPTALLSIHRRDTNTDTDTDTDTDTKASKKPGPNLNDFDPKFNARGIKQTDKPLLESFISHLGIQGAETLENLKSKLNNLESSDNLINFISYVRNGAFFKHWADHYTKQAQEMSKSLGLAA